MPREPIHSSIHALVRSRSLQELLDTARRSLSSPLILADLTYHVLAITRTIPLTIPDGRRSIRSRACR